MGSKRPKDHRLLLLNQNVRSCRSHERIEFLFRETRERKVLAITLQELWREGKEVVDLQGCTLLTNGLESAKGPSGALMHVGVGIALSKHGVAARGSRGGKSELFVDYPSGRTMGVRLVTKDAAGDELGMHLISAHAPDSGKSPHRKSGRRGKLRWRTLSRGRARGMSS